MGFYKRIKQKAGIPADGVFHLKTFWFLGAVILCLFSPKFAEGHWFHDAHSHNGDISMDREALIAFYNATGGDNWDTNTGWLGDAGTECSWYGIYCVSSVYGQPVPLAPDCGSYRCYYLELADNNLQGTLPYQIGNLEKLIRLNLSYNSLTGSIPAEITDLPRIYSLNLSNNSLTGSIPSGFTINNPWLAYLNLSNNQLTGSIPADLGNQKVFNPNFGSQGSLGSEWDSNGCQLNPLWGQDGRSSPCLSTLNLSNNQLSGSIPAELGNLIKLGSIVLQDNQLTGSIPPELGDLLYLRILYLSNNQLSGSIPAELGNLNKPYRGAV